MGAPADRNARGRADLEVGRQPFVTASGNTIFALLINVTLNGVFELSTTIVLSEKKAMNIAQDLPVFTVVALNIRCSSCVLVTLFLLRSMI